MLVSVILDNVRKTLHDPSAATWTDADDLIPALNDALKALVNVRPDAAAHTDTIILANGTRQTLPDDGVRLMKATRNKGVDGLGTGNAIRFGGNPEVMDSIMPTWHSSAESNVVREYFYDDRDPKTLWVYPPAPLFPAIGIEIIYVRTLPEIEADSDELPVDEYFSPALQEWMLYKLWGGDSELSPTYNQAQSRLNTFFTLLGAKGQADYGASAKGNRE